MNVIQTKISDVLIIEPNVFEDNRGWFYESYNKENLKNFGIDVNFVQDNRSFTRAKGTLRGLHFQNNPFAQSKLVCCTMGAIFDVAVDLRKNSPTYKKWISVELTGKNKKLIFIPRGFAHGFLSLTDNAEIQYKVDNYYNKQSEGIIRFDDVEIGIIWGNDHPILLERDQNAPFLKDCSFSF